MVAYVSERGGTPDLWVMRPNGVVVARLTKDAASESDPTWSPDGTRIAFVRTTNAKDDIYVIRLRSGVVENLTDRRTDFANLDWSPDGRTILFDAYDADEDRELFTIRARTTIDNPPISRVTDDTADQSDGTWSPDGSWIAYTLRAVEDGMDATQIWKLPVADPAAPVPLAAVVDGKDDATPVWSPDGTKIAWAHSTRTHPYSPDVWVMDADGTNPVKLVRDGSFELDQVTSWQPKLVAV